MNRTPNMPRRTARRVLCTSVLTIAVVSVLAGAAVAAIVTGTNGPDLLLGTSQADTITARDGNDIAYGLGRDDRLLGGNGDDFLNGDGRATCPPGNTDPHYCALSNSETSGGADYISGEAGNDYIEGGLGEDTIYGGNGVDRLYGESGNDVIFAIDGEVDTVDCGAGIDLVAADRTDRVSSNCEIRLSLRLLRRHLR